MGLHRAKRLSDKAIVVLFSCIVLLFHAGCEPDTESYQEDEFLRMMNENNHSSWKIHLKLDSLFEADGFLKKHTKSEYKELLSVLNECRYGDEKSFNGETELIDFLMIYDDDFAPSQMAKLISKIRELKIDKSNSQYGDVKEEALKLLWDAKFVDSRDDLEFQKFDEYFFSSKLFQYVLSLKIYLKLRDCDKSQI